MTGSTTDLDPNDERYRCFKEAQQLVRQHRHEEAVPGEGPQQGKEGQHTGAQQANVGTKHHQLLLQQRTYTSQITKNGVCCMQGSLHVLHTACTAMRVEYCWCSF